MAATAPSRSARSTAPGVSNGTPASRDAPLGAGDALLHRRFADQEGARDLLDREARDDAQRQRDLLRRRQIGMAADEQQPQHVVAVVGAVEPLGESRPRRRRDRRARPRRAAAAACLRAAPRRARRCGRRRSARRPDRAAGRSSARSSAPAGRPPETPPRPCRDRGNSAAAPPTAWGRAEVSAASIQARSVMSSRAPAWNSRPDASRRRRPGLASRELARDVERFLERLAVDHVEAEQLLLGLGERPVEHHGGSLVLAQRRRRGGRHQARDRAELALLRAACPARPPSFAMTASSCSLLQEQTTSSSW